MRVNVYAEEITDRVEIVTKKNEEGEFTGVRFYLELPVTYAGENVSGPFIHRPGDDDSAAVTFWGKKDLEKVLRRALELLEEHYKGNVRHAEVLTENLITKLTMTRGSIGDESTIRELLSDITKLFSCWRVERRKQRHNLI